MRPALYIAVLLLTSCASSKPFTPRSDYPPDPWVKSYTKKQDCLGGETLAAQRFELPQYPKRAYRTGRQGWVILRLDVDGNGQTENVQIERAVPTRLFSSNALKAAKTWKFHPPKDGPLRKCRVLLRYQLGAVSLGGS